MLSKNATKMLLLSVCYLSFHSEQFLAKIMLSHLRSYFHRIIDEKIMNIYCWFLVLHLMLSIRCNKIRIWTIYNYYVIFTIKFCVITVLALAYFFTRPFPIINLDNFFRLHVCLSFRPLVRHTLRFPISSAHLGCTCEVGTS